MGAERFHTIGFSDGHPERADYRTVTLDRR